MFQKNTQILLTRLKQNWKNIKRTTCPQIIPCLIRNQIHQILVDSGVLGGVDIVMYQETVTVKINEYIFRGNKFVIFSFADLLNGAPLLKERFFGLKGRPHFGSALQRRNQDPVVQN